MLVEVDPDDIQDRPTDDRGRVYLGKEHANKRLRVAVIEEVEEDGDA